MPRRFTPISMSSMAASPPAALGATTIVPFRNKNVAASGLLKNGKTLISEVTDGLSNTIAVIECAGRDERFVSQYLESLYPVVRGQGPAGYANGARHRFWRWADPGRRSEPRVSRTIRKADQRGRPWPTTVATAGNQAGPNEEPYSFHPGGVNALSVTARSILSGTASIWCASARSSRLPAAEAISSDSY